MFVDEVDIYVASGNGGSGCMSFRREKYVPKGGPDGGDGGRGGNIIFRVDAQLNTLTAFASKKKWIAQNGQPGSGKNRSGKDGQDLVIPVPPGTLIKDRDNDMQLKELTEPEEQITLLVGGRGGLGNGRFATPVNQTPRHAQPGEPGNERWLRLELKLIADVGLVGLPNAGKSTLLSRCTQATPRIADYPFTTLTPQLGIVNLTDYRQYTMADIPGLIEGAHEGTGLGDAFLRHIERTRVIIHLIDVLPSQGQPTPTQAYAIIRRELERYSTKLSGKPEIVAANKIDLLDNDDNIQTLGQDLGCPVIGISAVSGHGLSQLNEAVWARLAEQGTSQ